MARPLAHRLGQPDDDYIATFERAASRNFKDAERLQSGSRKLGAIYLYGYSVEMLVKSAYFRMAFAAAQPVLPATTRIDNARRRSATNENDPQGNRLATVASPHDISGWAALLTRKRALLAAANQAVAYSPILATEVRNRADRVYDHWKEYMRYRAVRVKAAELAIVRDDARWFLKNYQHL
jgi:hypothetical protein